MAKAKPSVKASAEVVVEEVLEKFGYDLEDPPQYKSPTSSNVYTVVARRLVGEDLQEIGLCLDHENGRMSVRFCVFSDTQPTFKNFSFRYGSKTFTKYPLAEEPETRIGCSMDKVEFRVFKNLKTTTSDFVQALSEDDGWDKLATWMSEAFLAEGFELCMAPEELVQLLPGVFVGIGIEKPVADIKYPGPITKPVAKVVKPMPSDDGDYEDFDNDPSTD